jgi:hypothetical protein
MSDWKEEVEDSLAGKTQVKGRPILYGPVDKDGLFTVPKKLDPKAEVMYAKRRMDSVRLAQYSDKTCGLPNTFDPTGAYLCGGLKRGASPVCNKFDNGSCLIRIEEVIAKPHQSSCGYWEIWNAGDPEGKYCPHGRMDDKRINFGTTESQDGFSCARCEYGQDKLDMADSEGRTRWCALKGHPVGDTSCCADNEPVEKE